MAIENEGSGPILKKPAKRQEIEAPKLDEVVPKPRVETFVLNSDKHDMVMDLLKKNGYALEENDRIVKDGKHVGELTLSSGNIIVKTSDQELSALLDEVP